MGLAPESSESSGSKREMKYFRSLVLVSAWQRIAGQFEKASRQTRILIFAVAALIGISGRLWAQTKPPNFDFNVWLTASSSLLDGVNPYAANQFNYGPSWLGIVTGIRFMSTDIDNFRLYIAIFLTLIDLGIAVVLISKRYSLAAVIFFISPVTIAISGQHQQVDNIAILTTLLATFWAVKAKSERIVGSDWVAVLLVGLGLSIKHVFLLLPIWLALRPGPLKKRIFYLVVPYSVFALSLLGPFLSARDTIIDSMVQYSGANNSPVLYAFLPDQMMTWVVAWQGPKVFFVIALIGSGYLFRHVRLFEFTLIYTISAVVFSWAIVNQYLAVPMAGIAIWMNLGFIIWLLLSSVYLWGDTTAINFPLLNQIQPHMLLEYDVVAKDLFPWIFVGWLLLLLNRKVLPQGRDS